MNKSDVQKMNKEEQARKILADLKKDHGLLSIANTANVSKQAVSKWKTVPIARLRLIAKLADLEPRQIRPDIYDLVESK